MKQFTKTETYNLPATVPAPPESWHELCAAGDGGCAWRGCCVCAAHTSAGCAAAGSGHAEC